MGFIEGDVEKIVAGLSDDVEWATDAERKNAPWHGIHKGKQGVRDFFAALLKSIEVTDFSPISLAENEHDVLCVIDFEFIVRATGTKVAMRLHHWWRFRDDKCYFYRGTEDTDVIGRVMRQAALASD